MQSEQLVEAEHSVQRLQRVRREQSYGLVLRDALHRLAIRVRRIVVLQNQTELLQNSHPVLNSQSVIYRSAEIGIVFPKRQKLLFENRERCESIHCGDFRPSFSHAHKQMHA